MTDLKTCPICGDSWIYASTGDYASGYTKRGYKVTCHCKGSFFAIPWQPTKWKAKKQWNRLIGRLRVRPGRYPEHAWTFAVYGYRPLRLVCDWYLLRAYPYTTVKISPYIIRRIKEPPNERPSL